MKMYFRVFTSLFLVAWAIVWSVGEDYKNNIIPEQIVFQVCIERAEEFNDVSICDCAEFVGHPDWCSGDIKY